MLGSEHQVKSVLEKQCSLFVFKDDLRIDDHELLQLACKNSQAMMLVYCLQPWQFQTELLTDDLLGGARYRFLMQSLQDLHLSLADQGQQLVLCLGDTESVVNKLLSEHHFSHIYHSESAGYYEQQQWQSIKTKNPGVNFLSNHTQSLYSASQLPFEVNQLPPHFTPFRKMIESVDFNRPVLIPDKWPEKIMAASDLSFALTLTSTENQEMCEFQGGHSAGGKHLNRYMNSRAPTVYKQVRNKLLGWHNSTKFSPWLAHGCMSARQIMLQLKDYEAENGANESTYWIFFELLWREFFYWNAIKQGPQLFRSAFSQVSGDATESEFDQWSKGRTAEPLVNACMRELNQTGFISNRGRQIAASFLIHETTVDWRMGASYFERHLIDFDVASNWGNWQYIAGVGADPRGGRRFNVKKQQKIHDPNQTYIKRWSTFEVTQSPVAWRDLVASSVS